MHSVKMQFLIYKLIHKDFAVLPKCRSCPCFSAALFRSRRHKLCIAHFRAKHEKYAHTVDPDGPGILGHLGTETEGLVVPVHDPGETGKPDGEGSAAP